MDPPAVSGATPATDKTSPTPWNLPSRSKIVLWGDSLTQTAWEGWGSHLANRYQRRADVLNRGMSGYNSKWFLELPLDEEGESQPGSNVALCIIWFGANDASLPELNPHHYVSVEEFQRNLMTLVANAKKYFGSTCKILLVTAPPVHHGQRLEYQKTRYGDKATGELERTLENSGKYAEACVEAATTLELPCLNLWKSFQTASSDWGNFLSDGLHFSPAGHDFVFQQLQEIIQKELPDLDVEPCAITGQLCNSGSKCEGLVSFGPYHDQIDSKNPSVSMTAAFSNTLPEGSSGAGEEIGSPPAKKAKLDAP